MTISTAETTNNPHIAIIPIGGMGNLNSMLRLSAMLIKRNCKVTLVTAKSYVSNAENNHISFFLKTHRQVGHLEFEPVPFENSSHDAFFLQYDAISRSAHLLGTLLSSLNLSAIICDFLVAKGVATVATQLSIPYYIAITSSARCTCFCLHLPVLASNYDKLDSDATEIEIPGLNKLPMNSIPTQFLSGKHPFARALISNVDGVEQAKAILIVTFDWFECKTMNSLKNGSVSINLPTVHSIGPLETYELAPDQTQCLAWLDKQPPKSVIFVSFGSRTALSFEQIKELRDGLESSGCRFLWILKTTEVDNEDKEDLTRLLGESFLERIKERGMVVKQWLNQQEILAHPAIGGFLSHCGWQSVVESAQRGMPVLAWPQIGDQMMNAEVVENAGLGIYDSTWGTIARPRLVKSDEIAKKVKELMEDPVVKSKAKKVGEEAKKAIELGGTSYEEIRAMIEDLRAL